MSSSTLSTLSAESPQALDSWQNVKRRLRVELGEDVFTSWFSRLELNTLSGDSAHLTVPTRFLKSWIEAHYADRVLALFREEIKDVAHITLSVRSPSRSRREFTPPSPGAETTLGTEKREALPTIPDSPLSSSSPQQAKAASSQWDSDSLSTIGCSLDTRLMFNTFVTGRSNALAHAAAHKIIHTTSGPSPYNPL